MTHGTLESHATLSNGDNWGFVTKSSQWYIRVKGKLWENIYSMI